MFIVTIPETEGRTDLYLKKFQYNKDVSKKKKKMLVSKKPGVPNASANQPNASANQPNVSSNISHWNIVSFGYARVGFALLIPIFSRRVPNVDTVFSGIWT